MAVRGATAVLPEGFKYQPELISQPDEHSLLSEVEKLPFKEFQFHGFVGKRRTVSYGWHYDFSDATPVFGDVIGVSLLSSSRFRFRRKLGSIWERASLTVEPRSAYLLRGPSRTEWEHSIPAVETLRYSITFRSLRKPQ